MSHLFLGPERMMADWQNVLVHNQHHQMVHKTAHQTPLPSPYKTGKNNMHNTSKYSAKVRNLHNQS